MSQISSINFKKSFAINTQHNDRTLAPSYLISNIGCEVNRTHKEALKLRNEIIKEAIETYNEKKSPKAPNFKAKSYEWSAVANIKSDTNMQDLEKLAEHFEKKYGFQCYQIAIHRDEGYINDDGKKIINHHAHLEFITLDKYTGKNMYRRELISPKILRQIQTEVAEILNMERGQDKRISKRERVEPRKYAQLKEQERKNTKNLKTRLENLEEENKDLNRENNDFYYKNIDLEDVIQAKDQEIQELEAELEQEKLKSKEVEAYIEQFRKNCAGKGLPKEFFRKISNLKQQAEPTTKELLDDTLNSLLQSYLKEKERNIELKNEIQSKDQQIEALTAEKEQFQKLLETDPALKKAYYHALKTLEKISENQTQQNQEQYQENMQNPNSYTTDDLLKAIDFKDDVSTLQTPNTDKTEVLEQDQEEDQTHNEDDLGIDKILIRKNK